MIIEQFQSYIGRLVWIDEESIVPTSRFGFKSANRAWFLDTVGVDETEFLWNSLRGP